MYVLSDDYFFSLGMSTVFKGIGESVEILPFNIQQADDDLRFLEAGDTLLLAVEFMDVVNKLLHYLSKKDVRVCLFINNSKGYEQYSGFNGIVSRRTPRYLMVRAVKRALKGDALRRITENLTQKERAVMDGLSTGASIAQVAQRLNITEKTVYNHKRKATQRMGGAAE